MKQLVSRVADIIWAWGKQGNYFETDADADTFHDELKYLLLHQYMAFNSPVWFNLGVVGERPQVSACFINSVEDTMESILTLAKTEGMLFKWGSGTGNQPVRSALVERIAQKAAARHRAPSPLCVDSIHSREP